MTPSSTPAPFSMNVTSRPAIPMDGFISIPKQKCVFLVTVEDMVKEIGEGKSVTVTAQATDSTVSVSSKTIISGEVSEVIVIPDEISIGKNLTVTIRGERESYEQTETIMIKVIDGEDELGPVAENIRDKFIPWLAINYPELGITSETQWIGTIVNPRILVVMHYIFLSDDWEIYLTWHVMIKPYDWAKIYLRHRFNETQPSYAFEIPSLSMHEEPHLIEVPDWV